MQGEQKKKMETIYELALILFLTTISGNSRDNLFWETKIRLRLQKYTKIRKYFFVFSHNECSTQHW